MNVKRSWPANAQSANAKIHGAVTSAVVVVDYCTCMSMTHALVSTFRPSLCAYVLTFFFFFFFWLFVYNILSVFCIFYCGGNAGVSFLGTFYITLVVFISFDIADLFHWKNVQVKMPTLR